MGKILEYLTIAEALDSPYIDGSKSYVVGASELRKGDIVAYVHKCTSISETPNRPFLLTEHTVKTVLKKSVRLSGNLELQVSQGYVENLVIPFSSQHIDIKERLESLGELHKISRKLLELINYISLPHLEVILEEAKKRKLQEQLSAQRR